jgi:NADPH2:quinone reductase
MREYGPPSVLVPGTAPDPVPAAGQVVIAVAAVGIAWIETERRSGRAAAFGPEPGLPQIPGNGVGGVVAALGAGVDPGLLGRRVVSSTGGSGAYAERVAVDAAGAVPVPDGLGLPDATALLADGRTAVGLIRLAAPQPGERVLVEAAAGGVGSLLIQLAVAAGATVVAAASSRRKLDLATELGAAVAVDYTRPGWAAEVRAAAGPVDVVFDGVGGEVGAAALGLVAGTGRFVVHGRASGTMTDPATVTRRGVRVITLRDFDSLGATNQELTAAALAEAAGGRLRPVIGQTFPLERAADAHTAMEARTTLGKTLLLC